MHHPRHAVRRVLVAVLVSLFVLLVGLSAAGAHSSLESTSPSAGSQVADSPHEIILQFTEPVDLALGGVRLFDSERNQVSSGQDATTSSDGSLVTVPLGPLPDDAYVVTWRVTSADSHPISGAFIFRVGDGEFAGDEGALVEELLAADGESEVAGGLYAVDRTLVFVGLAALVGLWWYVLLVQPASFGFRRLARMLWASWALLVVATALSIGLQGVTAGGLSLGDVADTSLWSAVLDTRFGQMAALRLGLLALAVPLVVVTGRGRQPAAAGPDEPASTLSPPWWQLAVGALSLGLFITVAWAGHAGAGRFVGLALTIDVVHLGAMCIWLGGLIGLLTVGFPGGDRVALRQVVRRFSTLAFACVITLVVSGSIQAWRQLGDLGAVTSTTYGRVLLVKLGIVAALVGLAAFSRAIVRRSYRTSDLVSAGPGAMASMSEVRDAERLERSVVFEVVLGVAVLVVTAFLVNIPPGIDVVDEPWTGRLAAGELTVDVTIDPAATGPLDVHVFVLDDVGIPVDVAGVTVELTLPVEDIGPLEVPVESAGRGHYVALGYELPFDGDWDLRVVVRVTDFEEVEAEGTVPID